MTIKYKAEMAT